MTGRQVAVCRELAKGRSNQEIADALFISIKTVKWHFTALFKEFEVTNRVDLLFKLKREKLIEKFNCNQCGRTRE